MPLSSGTKLGPYEIQSALGAGGMGEVYRARAARLGRDVAVKVSTESLAHDPERLRRFEHWPHIPIILLSGYPQDLPKEMLNQVDAFVWKGGDSSELLTTIRSVLNGQALLGTESLTVESPERLSKQSRAGV